MPSYSPDLNPDEYFHSDAKQEQWKRPERRQKGKWQENVKKTIEQIAKEPARVKSYFKAKQIQYAA